jgi:phosphohistidine phosphatase
MAAHRDVSPCIDDKPDSMMKTLYVLRHAKSGWDDPDLADHDRPLDLRGERAALVMGRYLAQRRFIPDLILCSTARRAVDTSTLVISQWSTRPAIECDRTLYLTGEKRVLQRLGQVADSVRAVLVIGHNPDLHDLVVALARRGDQERLADLAAKFPTAAFAAIKLPLEHWSDIVSVAGTLINYTVPKQLV